MTWVKTLKVKRMGMTSSHSKKLSEFCRGIKKAKSFLLASHVNPEGDAVACLLAMDSLLRRLGKKSVIVCEDPFPERLSILPSKRWNQVKDIQNHKAYDAVLIADCPTLERIGKTRDLITPNMAIFNIDHHHTNKMFGDYNYVKVKAAACGEVVFDIFKHLRVPIKKNEAEALYVSINTDTGAFKYSTATVETHRIAAELIETGLDVEKINENLYATYSLHKMRLYSRLMAKVQTDHFGDIAWVGMTREDLHHSGASYEDTEGFIDFLKYIREVKFAFFLSETETPNHIRVSIRSKGKYDASKAAAHFGGGGHQKASGCTIQGTLEDAAQGLIRQMHKQLGK